MGGIGKTVFTLAIERLVVDNNVKTQADRTRTSEELTTMEIRPFVAERDLDQLTYLINGHIGVLIPGWALPAEFIAQRLQRDPAEYVTDRWLDERTTLVGYSNGRLCAAIHLERYSPESPAGATWYIKWFVFWPDHQDLGLALLDTACSDLKRHGMQHVRLSQNLYTPGDRKSVV